MEFKDEKIGILGLGNENMALLRYLISCGATNITVCDKKSSAEIETYLKTVENIDIQTNFGENYLDNLSNFEIIFRTPGLAYLTPQIQAAKTQGIKISSQTKLFFDLCPANIIGVTGTKGKGTTSTLIYEMLKNSGKNVYLAGNIGNAPIEFLNELTADDIVVLELSSFQLQDLEKSPHIAVVLNVSQDHLDVHHDREEYIDAKENIVAHQLKEDFSCINADYLTSFEFGAQTPAQVYWFSRRKSIDQGAWVGNGKIYLRKDDIDIEIADVSDISLRGEHNLENICAAITAVSLLSTDIKSISAVAKSFKGLEHRLELVSDVDGVEFYNDSFSTTPDTAIAAIKSFTEPIILIAGGSQKNASYKELGQAIDQSNIKTVILIGVTGPQIKSEIKNPKIEIISDCHNFQDAVSVASQKAEPGDVVLLSPASASFDWFKNYKERGERFKAMVQKLK